MPLQVMDTSKNEGKGKFKGKGSEISKEKTLLDFFKTPDKEPIKQKSLLQFFVKSNPTFKNTDETISGQGEGKSVEVNKENVTEGEKEVGLQESKGNAKKSFCKQFGRKKGRANAFITENEDGRAMSKEVVVNGDSSDSCIIECENDLGNQVADTPETKENTESIRDVEADDSVIGCIDLGNTNTEREDGRTLSIVEKKEVKITSNETGLLENPTKGDETIVGRDEEIVPKVSKRNNLKAQDMLNLLKEVQVTDKKEKKKKNKHKLHKHKSKDEHENIKGDCDELNTGEIGVETSKIQTDNHKENDDLEYKETNIPLGIKLDNSEFSRKKKEVCIDETKKKDKKFTINKTKEPNSSQEMSYTEFLAKLSQNETSQMEVDVDEVGGSDKESESSLTVGEAKLIKSNSDRTITNFFSFTSTPGKDQNEKNINKEDKSVGELNTKIEIKSVDTSIEEIREKRKDFLQSKVNLPQKNSTQATLCFGSDGIKMSKQYTVLNSSNNQKDKKAARKGKHSVAEKGVEKSELNTSESVFVTPVQRKTRKRKLESYEELSTDLDESDLTDGTESDGRRRSQRKKYKVTVFQMDEERKTPIKIKLRRCAKSSSSGNEELPKSVERKAARRSLDKAKTNVKQTKALALLEKAKSQIHKTKIRKKGDKEMLKPKNKDVEKIKQSDVHKRMQEKKKKGIKKKKEQHSDGELGNARRSSRLEGKLKISMEEVSIDNIVISSDEESSSTAKPAKKRKKKDETSNGSQASNNLSPVKVAKGKSPIKKSCTKLAPMFLMGKKGSTSTASPVKPALNPEQARQRQMFLMSGVPDELKKQTAQRQANTLLYSYPPIPTVNHVQQQPETARGNSHLEDLSVWKLEKIGLKLRAEVVQSPVVPVSRFVHTKIQHDEVKTATKKQEKLKPMAEDTIDKCLNEVIMSNPSYRVKEMYKAFRGYKLDSEAEPKKTDTNELRTDMKGILSENFGKTDKESKKTRRSLKLNKKDNAVELVEAKPVQSTPEGSPQSASSTLFWTDKYYPANSSEILGNAGSLKKLKDWLLEWKQVLDREAKKARKLLMKKNKGKMSSSSKDSVWDDDSDFDIDSEDSEDDSSLCNTTLLVGPHGCGKTSSVYALAQQLGFKVHEVNASSSRTGRHILSQLQEATQSHQVSSQGCHTPSKKKGIIEKTHSEGTQPKSKMALSFTNLMSKAACKPDSNKSDKEKKSKKLKGDKGDKMSPKEKNKIRPRNVTNKQVAAIISEDSNSQSIGNSMNLSRTTLILFEEVDVVFEEDKGFLTAVQTFMSTTKIPIILTSTKRNFSTTFDGRVECINLKRPSVAAVTSHLQTIALTENMRTDYVKLSELVKLNECDMRRCILSLQYLIQSGGSQDRTLQRFKGVALPEKTNPCISEANSLEITSELNVDKSDDDFDDFVTLKGRRNKRRRILDDTDSNSGDVRINKVSKGSVVVDFDSCSDDEGKNCPVVYGLGLKCLLAGLLPSSHQSHVDCIKEYLQGQPDCCIEDLIEICQTFQSLTKTSLLYSNMHLLLPLSYTVCDQSKLLSRELTSVKKRGRKRKRVQCDLYDSEGSGSDEKVLNSNLITEQSRADPNQETEQAQAESCLKTGKSEVETVQETEQSQVNLNQIIGKREVDTAQETDQAQVKSSQEAGKSQTDSNQEADSLQAELKQKSEMSSMESNNTEQSQTELNQRMETSSTDSTEITEQSLVESKLDPEQYSAEQSQVDLNLTKEPSLVESNQEKKDSTTDLNQQAEQLNRKTDQSLIEMKQKTEHSVKESNVRKILEMENSNVIKSLSSFANYYDTMTSLDVIRTLGDMKVQDRICQQNSIKGQTKLPPGLEDELHPFTCIGELDLETVHEIESCIETRAFCKLSKDLQNVKDEMVQSDTSMEQWEEFTIPVFPGMDEFQMNDSGTSSSWPERQRAVNDIKDNLPYTLNKNGRCIHMDYIPTLREICRSENSRLTANTKRRFHHYLDSIALPLKDKTMTILATTLT